MLSKSKSLDSFLELPPLAGSALLHLTCALFFGLLIWWNSQPVPQTVEMVLYEEPSVAPAAKPIEAAPKVETRDTRRAIFGASRKSMTAENSQGLDVKAGNTVAKTPDQETLTDDDADRLPIPVDEYTVSEMPVLANEFRIPYPPEAKKAGVQGAVVMDLLIDSKGTVREAKLISGPGSGLNEAALEAVKRFSFRPAKVAANNVAVRIRYSYRFVLER